jgi:hypothetical protein
MTKPWKWYWPLSTPVISSCCACILTGLPTPSSIQSTLENDGMTLPTWCRLTAGSYGAKSIFANSSRLVTVMPWSIV